MKNRITASNTDYEYAYGLIRITPAAAKTMLNLRYVRLKFNSLEQMIEFLKGIKIVSNNIHFGRMPARFRAKRTKKEMRVRCHSVAIEKLDIRDKLEEAGFEPKEADFTFSGIESVYGLVQDQYRPRLKRMECRINKHIYRFYFDVKKTFNW